MPSSSSSAVNVGELIRRGVVLDAQEAVSIVHEVCRQTSISRSGAIAEADALWIDASGELSIARSVGTAAVHGFGIPMLLDELLPPTERLEYPVPSALRSLPTRLSASAAALGNPNARDLLTILRQYLDDDPGQVLQNLFHRVRAMEPTHDPAPTVPERLADSAAARRPAFHRDSSADALNVFSAESGSQDSLEHELAGSHDPDVFRTEQPHPVLTGQARRRTRTAAQRLAAMALIMAAGYAGYRVGQIPATNRTRTTSEVAAAEPAQKDLEVTAATPAQTQSEVSAPAPRPEPTSRPAQTGRASTPAPAVAPGSAAAVPTNSEHGPAATARSPQPLMIAVDGGAFSPSFAPAGGKLLFHAGRTRTGRLLEADLDGRGQPSRIAPILATSVPGVATRDYHARLSPDARRLAFDSDRDGQRGVYIANPDGSQAARVSGDGFAAVPSWSPDMKWLAFLRAEPNRPRVWNLWLLDLASGMLSRQTSFRAGQVWGASWFPDSQRLCFSHEDRLIVTNLGSGVSESFRTPRPGHLVRTPAVAPDGRRIVFQVFRDGVWLLDLPTRSMRRILADPTAEEFAWDPNGRRIAYHSRQDGTWRIWVATVSAAP